MEFLSLVPDAIAIILWVMTVVTGRARMNRPQMKDLLPALRDAGLVLPESKGDLATSLPYVEEVCYRHGRLFSGRHQQVAAGSVSGGSLIATVLPYNVLFGVAVLVVWILFFTGSMFLWTSATIETLPRIEARQKWISLAYILLSVLGKALFLLFSE